MYPWIFGFGILFAFYNAWGIGANDCANSFATSVGSGVLTLKKAVIIAAIFEFSGAVLMGSHVTDTVRKTIVNYFGYLFLLLDQFELLVLANFLVILATPLALQSLLLKSFLLNLLYVHF